MLVSDCKLTIEADVSNAVLILVLVDVGLGPSTMWVGLMSLWTS